VSAPTHPSSKQSSINCDTQGHLWGAFGVCIMCKAPRNTHPTTPLEYAMRNVERCRNYPPGERVENEDVIVILGDAVERITEELRLARIETAHFANTQRATQADGEMSSLALERYKQALYQANGRLMQLDQEPVKLDYSVSPPREGYSQAYADQMRTALLRIAGWREIDRNSLGERLREIEEIALAALMPTVTKSAESSPQGVQHGLAHREDETGRYSVPGEGTAL
jgi:hypothetical protein